MEIVLDVEMRRRKVHYAIPKIKKHLGDKRI